jgi:hypothetical protein
MRRGSVFALPIARRLRAKITNFARQSGTPARARKTISLYNPVSLPHIAGRKRRQLLASNAARPIFGSREITDPTAIGRWLSAVGQTSVFWLIADS